MGSIITNILFMPPLKVHDDDTGYDDDKFLTTAHGSQIQVKILKQNDNYLYMIISHGNAENIYIVNEWVTKILKHFVNVNFVMYEYTGYRLNHENFSCSEQFCYNDAEAVYEYVTKELKIPPERIVIFGRSLGSGPSCYLAEKHKKVAGLILISGFMSVYRVAFKFRWTLPGDMFPNIDRIKNIECPVCIIHSIKDEIVPFYHARQMLKYSKNKFPPLYIDGTNHNDIDKNSDDAYKHMQKFFQKIDPNYEMKDPKEFYEK